MGGHVMRTGQVRNERIILDWILGSRVGRRGLDAYGSGQGPVAGYCEHGNET
jgi:hypothetical protein